MCANGEKKPKKKKKGYRNGIRENEQYKRSKVAVKEEEYEEERIKKKKEKRIER